jgi:hypothetical protein
MAKADPSNRTGFKEGPAPGQRDLRNEILGMRKRPMKVLVIDSILEKPTDN